MVNILIADDNIYYAKILMDLINNSIKDIKIINIAIDGKETLDKLSNDDNIDICILDLKMPIINGIEVMHKLSNEKQIKYKNSIIVISGESEMISQIRDNDMVFDFISKMNSMSDIVEKLDKLVKYKEEKKHIRQLKGEIMHELQELGYNFSHKGTLYLIDAIYLICTNKIKDDLNLKKNVYPTLAQKYNRPIHCIKSDIIKATDYMDNICELKKKKEYFSFNDNTKPTVKLVIYTILNKIYLNKH